MTSPQLTQTFNLQSAGPNPTATLLVPAGNGVTLIYNNGPNTVYLSDQNYFSPGDPTVIPLAVGSAVNVNGQIDKYGIVAVGAPSTVYVMSDTLNFFAPTSLTGLGGVKVFNQAATPTPPPAIPVNSLWFDATGRIMV